MGNRLLRGLILATFVAWLLLVFVPLLFPKIAVVPADRLPNVSLVLTTLIGIGIGPEVYQRMKNGGKDK